MAARFTSCTTRPLMKSAFNDVSRSLLAHRPQALALTPNRQTTAIARRQASVQIIPGTDGPLIEREKRRQQEMMAPDPEHVTGASSVHPVFSEVDTPEKEQEEDMMKGIKGDMACLRPIFYSLNKVLREVMALNEVPVEAYRIGMAGVLPYLATASATVYCAFEYNTAATNEGSGYLLSEHTAEIALHILEPLQIGYGAVILSFLGAIHWGLEWAGYGGQHGYRRYAVGVLAPAIAWPTLLLPVEYALIGQFVAFNLLYSKDADFTKRGWCPPWYSTYRFVLTFIVGGSIVLSLIGRGQLSDRIGSAPTATERVKELNKKIKDQI
ncbi:MAG: hypothetical protein M1828_003130 [Chrysothrix sp. TS-e1954]|nr:MAG: hypothetical protein M1828_003130 [Chrysothrix sp. TS-e1954]